MLNKSSNSEKTKKVITNSNSMETAKVPNSKPKKVAKIVAVVLIILASAAAGYFGKQYQLEKTNPTAVAQKETAQLVEQVGKLMVLPADETPTVATVNDPEKLKEQPFFANAKKGDKVLIYTNAKKAILFDPIANKILEVAPLNIGAPSSDTLPTPTPTPSEIEVNE